MKHLTLEEKELALSFYEELDTPRALTCAILFRSEQWLDLVSLNTNPSHYDTAEAYLGACAATDFLRKFSGFPSKFKTRDRALSTWRQAEFQCYQTNQRLSPILHGTFTGPEDLLIFTGEVRKEVRHLIGDLDEIPDGRFGPGATVSDRANRSTLIDKLESTVTLTPAAMMVLPLWRSTLWGRRVLNDMDELKIVEGNTFFTVPKTALTDRSCGKEPSLNGFYQLGLGRELRSRLKTKGYDLVNAQDLHRDIARSASFTGDFATIDLSSASDTISTAVIRLLIPPRWYEALNALRSPYTYVDGKRHLLEKFSSMGNGFTFELETVVFLSIARAVASKMDIDRSTVKVFGDDIIVPTSMANLLVSVLSWFGFTTNPKKTFLEGPFRESCGGDYWLGQEVRAHFQENPLEEPSDFIAFHNGIQRVFARLRAINPRRHFSGITAERCRSFVPLEVRRCWGPSALGDVVFHGPEERWNVRWRWGIRQLRSWAPAQFRKRRFGYADPLSCLGVLTYLAGSSDEPLLGATTDPSYPYLIPRDSVMGYKATWVCYS